MRNDPDGWEVCHYVVFQWRQVSHFLGVKLDVPENSQNIALLRALQLLHSGTQRHELLQQCRVLAYIL